MRTEQEILTDFAGLAAMRKWHIDYDQKEETALMVEAAEWVLANRKEHDDGIRIAEHIIKEYGNAGVPT